jgi:dienelactone hydrolase
MKPFIALLLLCPMSFMANQCKPSVSRTDTYLRDTAVVIQTIRCREDTAQTYCIALPADYDPARRYPVIFVFDPHGDGHLAVHTFLKGASEFGSIVAGSNVIRNGYEQTEYALQRLAGDVGSRYSVDMDRMYAAGFSGGGRVAQQFSQLTTSIKSVASIGAGYSLDPSGTLRNKVSMIFIAGNEDFNYHEIRSSDQVLRAAGIHYYILEYPGKHAWPGDEIILDVLHWFEFDYYRRNPARVQKQTVKKYMAEIRMQARHQEVQQDAYGAAGTYAKGISFLSGIVRTGSLKSKLAGLQKTEAYKQSEKQAGDALALESRLQQAYMLALKEHDTLWWKNEMRGLDEKINHDSNSTMQPVYSRIKNFISIAAYSYCNGSLRQNDLRTAERYISIYRTVDPGNPDVSYFNALFLSKSGRQDAAADSFRKAVADGFTDFAKARQELPAGVFSKGYAP